MAAAAWTSTTWPVWLRIADATALDEPDGSFDAATLVHVGMNIADKAGLFVELARILRPGGTAIVYDVMRAGPGSLTWPMPWAPVGTGASFLATPATYRDALEAAGLADDDTTDQRDLVRDALAASAAAPPPVTLGDLIGPGFPPMFANLGQAMQDGLVAPVQVVATRATPN